jgi:heptosyltransferase-2
MGDVVLQTATVNWLKALYGEKLKISFVTSQEFVSLINSHPEISHVIGFDRRKGEKWRDLVKKVDLLNEEWPIDLILDLHGTLRSFRLRCSFWTTPALTVDKRRWERFFLTKIKSVALRNFFNKRFFKLEPQVERIIKDFQGIFGDSRGYTRTKSFVHGPHEEVTTLGPIENYQIANPYIVLAPSASFKFKRWPVNSFVKLAQELLLKTNFDIVILAGPTDDFCDAFNTISSPRLRNLQGKTSLADSMGVLKGAKLCIGNDSGMNHISEAYGVPCLTLFGPTDPHFGFIPHGTNSRYLSKELWCKPCSTTGKKNCFRDKHYCMEDITVDEVLSNTLSMVGAS